MGCQPKYPCVSRLARISEKWSSEIIATYTGVAKTSSSNTRFVPDASTIIDAITNFKINDRFSLDLGLYNIFDTKYYNYQTVKNESPTAADLDKFSEPGANVKVGFKFKCSFKIML